MSPFANLPRTPAWNYGGSRWRLSRSKIDLFMECPRCFYLDNKLGTVRPRGFPFNLNTAVDVLLKKEFDIHRARGTPHPIMQAYGIEAVPFSHPELNVWRENFKGIECKHDSTGLVVSGAIDDIWVNPAAELLVVDYKSTSKDGRIEALDQEWHDGYKRQMEVYQWLLRQRGFAVSTTGYFVYANARRDRDVFDGTLEFDLTLISHAGNTDWIEATLHDIKACLEGGEVPPVGDACEYCSYREAVGVALRERRGESW